MEWSKLKNIIILILLLANLFLLSMVIVQERGSTRYQEQALDNALSVLEQNGIRMERSVIPDELTLAPMDVKRDREAESQLALALLGACETSELGGGRYAYQGPLGWAEFRSNGNFSVTFTEGTQKIDPEQSAQEHALALMGSAGLDCVLTDSEDTGDGTVLTLRQMWDGVPVYSCRITMEYGSESLLSISGQRLMGEPQPDGAEYELLSVPTALLRVLNGINDLNDICNEITAMESGYVLTTSAEEICMIPVWYVTTDTGVYSLNALTGALERA